MGDWTARAEQLAADIREPGYGAAAASAAAWAARVDPDALRSLHSAALVLTDGEALSALWSPLPPCPDQATLLEWGENLESHVGDLLKRCTDLGSAARSEHDAAVRAMREAAREARDAAAAIATSADAGRAAAQAALGSARERERDAYLVIADCEAALDLLQHIDGKLRYSLVRVCSLPADLSETYESTGRLIASGGTLPHSGDFITPHPAPETDGRAA
jgi:hypothetical protein